MHQVSIRATWFTQQKQWGLYQNKDVDEDVHTLAEYVYKRVVPAIKNVTKSSSKSSIPRSGFWSVNVNKIVENGNYNHVIEFVLKDNKHNSLHLTNGLQIRSDICLVWSVLKVRRSPWATLSENCSEQIICPWTNVQAYLRANCLTKQG